MIPAPAQGAMLVVAMDSDEYCRKALFALNHRNTAICVELEREFLQVLEGGCTAPIGALATIEDDELHFKGGLFGLDGKQKFEIEKIVPLNNIKSLGRKCAEEVLAAGGAQLMKTIKQTLN